MSEDIAQLKHRLTHLVQDAQNPKLLWEEMQQISKRAFQLQDDILTRLDDAENHETDIARLQNIFDTREQVWDMMTQLAVLETTLKEKTFKKGGSIQPTAGKPHKSHTCCCHGSHHDEDCDGGCDCDGAHHACDSTGCTCGAHTKGHKS